MRTKPCWSDSLGLEILAGWLLAIVVAIGLVLLSECTTRPAHAEAYLDVAGGMTQFLVTANPGDYIQKDQPHSLDLRSMAYKVGLGWKFNERWQISAAYVNFGTINQTAKFVRDEDFDFKSGTCKSNCSTAIPYKMTDAYHGGELTVTRTFKLDESWAWHLKAGGAYLMHRFTINREDSVGGAHENYGQFPAVVAGVGASWKALYVSVDYYHGLGGSNGFMGHDQGWPLAKEMIVTWFGVRIPLGS